MPELTPPFRPSSASRPRLLVLLAVLFAPAVAFAAVPVLDPPEFSVLPLEEIGALTFRRAHPEWNGEGVVIGILDSGVDLGVPGLDQLPGGGRKILDARDFSGQGDVKLTRAKFATRDGRAVLEDKKDRVIFGVDRLPVTSPDSTYWLGFLEEKEWRFSAVKDLNGNGANDDRFAVLAFAPALAAADSDWVALVDLDGDGDLSDEAPIRSYGISGQVVRFRSSTDKEKLHPINGGLTIRPADKLVEIHLADNGHGTHVAGIAAGYRIGGQDGLDGVAPGARLLSLKIGNNSLAGGATTKESVKKAVEWAVEWASERGWPIVFNMSYGIESDREGTSDIEKLVDDLLLKHPRVVFVTSNGNNGPGLSTAGTPGTARFGISAGNMVSDVAAPALGGHGVRRDLVNFGSSRGGEVPKPTVIAPGTVLSTVPPFDGGEVKNGTSMASPYVAGAAALLLSSAVDANVPWTFATVRQAIAGTAEPLPGFTLLDQGGGLVQVSPAWEALKGLASRANGALLTTKVEVTNPFFASGKGPAAFWRGNGWYPAPPREVSVTLTPIFADTLLPDARAAQFRDFDLEADVPWIRLDRKSIHLSGEGASSFELEYVPSALTTPGLYVGRVRGYARGMGGPKLADFEVWHSVIIPWRFDGTDGTREWSGEELEPGGIRRFFIEVPAGASALELIAEATRESEGQVRVALFDPEGHAHVSFGGWSDPKLGTRHEQLITGRELRPGTWEAIVGANTANRRDASFRLEARLTSFDCRPDTIHRFEMPPAEPACLTASVTNLATRPFEGRAEGTILGWRRERTIEVRKKDTWESPITLPADIEEVTFVMTVTPSMYARVSDIVMSLLDKDGIVLNRSSFDTRTGKLSLTNPNRAGGDPGSYRLQLWPGFVHDQSTDDWSFQLVESYRRRDREAIKVKSGDSESLILYPGVAAELVLTMPMIPREAPDGAFNYGEILFKDDATKRTRGVWPIRLDAR